MPDDSSYKAIGPSQVPLSDTNGVSRRALLAGTAGLGIGGLPGTPAAVAQQAGHQTQRPHPSAIMSDRIYSANPSSPQMVGLAENPANVPPPITRTEPETVEVNLETLEIEAFLDTNTMQGVTTKTVVVRQIGVCQGAACHCPVSLVMTHDVVSCRGSDLLQDASLRMKARDLKYIPLVDDTNRSLGLLTARAVLRVLLGDAEDTEAQLVDYVGGVGYR